MDSTVMPVAAIMPSRPSRPGAEPLTSLPSILVRDALNLATCREYPYALSTNSCRYSAMDSAVPENMHTISPRVYS